MLSDLMQSVCVVYHGLHYPSTESYMCGKDSRRRVMHVNSFLPHEEDVIISPNKLLYFSDHEL